MVDCGTFRAAPASVGQLAHFTGTASQHPAAWRLLAHVCTPALEQDRRRSGVAGQLVLLAGSASRPPAVSALLAHEKQARGGTTAATCRNFHPACGGMADCGTYSAAPASTGQLAHLTGTASRHPAAWKLLAPVCPTTPEQDHRRSVLHLSQCLQKHLCSYAHRTRGEGDGSAAHPRYICGSRLI